MTARNAPISQIHGDGLVTVRRPPSSIPSMSPLATLLVRWAASWIQVNSSFRFISFSFLFLPPSFLLFLSFLPPSLPSFLPSSLPPASLSFPPPFSSYRCGTGIIQEPQQREQRLLEGAQMYMACQASNPNLQTPGPASSAFSSGTLAPQSPNHICSPPL